MGLRNLIECLGKKTGGLEKLPPPNEWDFSIALRLALETIVYEIRMDAADETSLKQLFGGVYAGYYAEVPCPQDTGSVTFYQKGLTIGYEARRSGLEEKTFKRILVSNYPLRKA